MNKTEQFKTTYKHSACTRRPWEHLIPENIRYETLLKVKKECLDLYGFSFDECNKRKICFTKTCLGRELEWKSPTALPYLKDFAAKVGIKEGSNYTIETNCQACPVFQTCRSPCSQVNDFIHRDRELKLPIVYYQEQTKEPITTTVDNTEIIGFNDLKIPWDALPDRKANVIKKYIFQYKDFLTIAKELDLTNQAQAKYEFYSALTTLSEIAVMRKFLEESGEDQLENNQLSILNAIYYEGKTLTEVAEGAKVSKQAIQQLLTRIIAKFNLKWSVFVRKQGNKVIYNVPELLK